MAVEMIGASRCSLRPSEKNISPLAKRLGFRRIATRYDKLARNYFSALCLVAAVAFWLN